METILTSPTQEVRIGPDHPFVIIGERITPTGRKKLAAEMAAADFANGAGQCRGRQHGIGRMQPGPETQDAAANADAS